MAAFETLGLIPELTRALEGMGWSLPTPVQEECIPLVLSPFDLEWGDQNRSV